MPKKKAGEVENFYVSFSDLLSLLLIFFIYLFSIAEVNPTKYAEGSASVESEFSSTSELIEQTPEQAPDAAPAPSKSKSGIAQAIKDLADNVKKAIESKEAKAAKEAEKETKEGLAQKEVKDAKDQAKAKEDHKDVGKDPKQGKQKNTGEHDGQGSKDQQKYNKDSKAGQDTKPGKEKEGKVNAGNEMNQGKDKKPGKDKQEAGKEEKQGKEEKPSKESKQDKDKKEPAQNLSASQQAAKIAEERKALKDMKAQLDDYIKDQHLENVVSVEMKGDQLGLTLRDNLMFNTGEAILIGKSYPILKTLAGMLKTNKSIIAIEGYTDDMPIRSGSYPSNWELSAARAASVLRYLSGQGVSEGRFTIVGHGQFKPVAKNDSEENRAKNRRVKVILKVDVEAIRPQKKQPKPAGKH